MTSEEAGKFLDQIQALYPKFLRETEQIDVAMELWHEMLQDVTFEEAHKALIHYQKHDLNGYPPTFAQLFPPEEEWICIRDETIEDWN